MTTEISTCNISLFMLLEDDSEDETGTFFVIWGENFRFEVLWMSNWNHIQSKIYLPDNTYDKSSCYAYLRPEDICKCKLQDCSLAVNSRNVWNMHCKICGSHSLIIQTHIFVHKPCVNISCTNLYYKLDHFCFTLYCLNVWGQSTFSFLKEINN